MPPNGTLSLPHHQPSVSAGPAYWCEFLAFSATARDQWLLDERAVGSPAGAVAWMRRHAAALPSALYGSAAEECRAWLADSAYQSLQAAALTAGRRISLNFSAEDHLHGLDIVVTWSLSCRRIPSIINWTVGDHACP